MIAAMTDKEAIEFLEGKLGKPSVLAVALGVKPQRLSNWKDEQRGISAGMRPAIWAMVNDHGGNLPREWLLQRSEAA